MTTASIADSARLDELFAARQTARGAEAERIEHEIWSEWSKSGSPAMDLLLSRGRQAMQAGDLQAAIEHFTALTDHAPDFAEGWNARATAYFHAGLYGPSLDDIAHVLALNPRHFGAISGLAMILEETGNPEDAIRAYREVLAILPEKQSIMDNIARLEKQVQGTDL